MKPPTKSIAMQDVPMAVAVPEGRGMAVSSSDRPFDQGALDAEKDHELKLIQEQEKWKDVESKMKKQENEELKNEGEKWKKQQVCI